MNFLEFYDGLALVALLNGGDDGLDAEADVEGRAGVDIASDISFGALVFVCFEPLEFAGEGDPVDF